MTAHLRLGIVLLILLAFGCEDDTASPGDPNAPAPVTNLLASSNSPYSAVLTWSATGDDGQDGQADSYDIRYATDPITEDNFTVATQVTQSRDPLPAGQREYFIVTGLTSNTTYYFALRPVDEKGNFPEISNVVSTSTSVTLINPAFTINWGQEGPEAGQFNNPVGVAVDFEGNVFVSDQLNHRIQKFNSNGGFIRTWGAFGTGNGQFNKPRGIAIDSENNVWVVDESNERVQKFDSDGVFIKTWGTAGIGPGQFVSPVDIATDRQGNIFITDFANPRVQKFDSEMRYLARWGTFGTSPGQFHQPTGIALDAAGDIYVADGGNHRVQRFTNAGVFLGQFGASGAPFGPLEFPTGLLVLGANVYVADATANRIQIFDVSGTFIQTWGTSGTADGQFTTPQDLATDFGGSVFVVESGNHRVQKFNFPTPAF